MQTRGEANPAVSINEPSLEAVLISGCTVAVLFTTPPSLTLLIPNGFRLRRGSITAFQKYNMKLLYVLKQVMLFELESEYRYEIVPEEAIACLSPWSKNEQVLN